MAHVNGVHGDLLVWPCYQLKYQRAPWMLQDSSGEDDQADAGAGAAVTQPEAGQGGQPDGSGGAAPEPAATAADTGGSGWDRMAAELILEPGALLALTDSVADQLDQVCVAQN